MVEIKARAWTGEIMFSPFPYNERANHPDWLFMLGISLDGKDIYVNDVMHWMADDGECYKGIVEFRENGDERCFFIAGFCIPNPINITEQVTADNGEMLEGWNGELEVIGNTCENPKL